MNQQVRVNQRIRAHEVRLIGPNANQLGIFSIADALAKAQEEQLDLIEISPNAAPPVCKIMNYGKWRYEQGKREKDIRHHQQGMKTKEIQFRPNIDEHDLEVKIRHIREFLESKMRVRVLMCYRGREMSHQELGKQVIEKIVAEISDCGTLESPPRLQGKTIGLLLRPGK